MILFFGQNTGSNSPRFLHPLKAAVKRGCRIVTFNPVRERGLIEFVDPQNPVQMTVGKPTVLSEMYLQVRPGGDIAAILGVAKRVLAREDRDGGVLDRDFIAEHTTGFEAFEATARATGWEAIEAASGLTRAHLERVGDIYCVSERVIGIYGMGLTQHVHGSQSIGMLVNLLLMRGNIGREGAGISPVRGHSNVQGQRTVGISEKPELVPLDRLAAMFDFDPPRDTGRTTVEVVEGVLDGSVRAFLSLGGNFAHAIPDLARVEPHWAKLALNVQIATKLNAVPPAGRRRIVSAAVPGTLRTRRTGERPSGGVDGGLAQPHLRLDRQATARLAVPQVRTGDRRRDRQGDVSAQYKGALGRVDRRLWHRARLDRGDLPRRISRLQRADVPARRILPRQRGARAGVEDGLRPRAVHRPDDADVARRRAGRRGVHADHAAVERSVQHHHLRLRGSAARLERHPHGAVNQSGRDRARGAGERSVGDAGQRRGRRRRAPGGGLCRHPLRPARPLPGRVLSGGQSAGSAGPSRRNDHGPR